MFDVDFLASTTEIPDSSSSYDAIIIRFQRETDPEPIIVVIDGGFTDKHADILFHLDKFYKTDHINLLINTHPDQDHLNGLIPLVQQAKVDELLIHQPRLYRNDLANFTNLSALDDLLGFAELEGIPVTQPFTGLELFDGALTVLGPTEDYYKQLLDEQLSTPPAPPKKASAIGERLSALFDKALSHLPFETLGNDNVTSARNNSSVICVLNLFGHKLLFTGDAGIPALEAAADAYEANIGSFQANPLRFFQAPHHGSKHNLGTDLLDRIFGPKDAPYSTDHRVFISAAKQSLKHPSPKVTNALIARGCSSDRLGVTAIVTGWIHHRHNSPDRPGSEPIKPYPILPED